MTVVYLVKQHQADSEYDNYIVDIFDSEEKARAKCQEHNKEYADNVGLDEQGNFTGEYDINGNGYYHYYDYFSMVLK